MPNYIYAVNISPSDKKDLRGFKYMASKDRITLMVCANAVGDKAPLFVIGTSSKPRSFHKGRPAGMVYASQPNAWMDRSLCEYWFSKVFVPFKRRVLGESEKAVLIWDNAPAHALPEKLLKLYPDIVIIPLPANLTARHQPMDAGIIAALKARYKMELVCATERWVNHWDVIRERARKNPAGVNGIANGHAANMYDACLLAVRAWEKVTAETVINCNIKAQYLPRTPSRSIMLLTEKGRTKLMVRERQVLASQAVSANDELEEAGDGDAGVRQEDGGVVIDEDDNLPMPRDEMAQLIEKMDQLAEIVEENPAMFTGANGARHKPLMDVCTAQDANITDKLAALLASITVEDNEQVVEAIIDEAVSKDQANLWKLPCVGGDDAAAGGDEDAMDAAEDNATKEDSTPMAAEAGLTLREKFKRFVEFEPVLMELAKLSDSERAAKTFVDAVEAYFARVKRTQRSLHSFLQNTV